MFHGEGLQIHRFLTRLTNQYWLAYSQITEWSSCRIMDDLMKRVFLCVECVLMVIRRCQEIVSVGIQYSYVP